VKFTIIEAEQRSPEWFLARAGRVTGSRADALLAKGRGSAESIQRRDYRLQIACERLTGIPQEGGYVNAEMQRGIDLEPFALAAYEVLTGEMVRKTGFLSSDEIMVGCSLDGDIANFSGILELKCPKSATHIGYWRSPDSFIDAYRSQVLHNLWVTGAGWCDLVSFDDRMPKPLQLLRVRIARSDADVARYAEEVNRFLAEVGIEVQDINELMKTKEAA
jgi:hypothetical protein